MPSFIYTEPYDESSVLLNGPEKFPKLRIFAPAVKYIPSWALTVTPLLMTAFTADVDFLLS